MYLAGEEVEVSGIVARRARAVPPDAGDHRESSVSSRYCALEESPLLNMSGMTTNQNGIQDTIRPDQPLLGLVRRAVAARVDDDVVASGR